MDEKPDYHVCQECGCFHGFGDEIDRLKEQNKLMLDALSRVEYLGRYYSAKLSCNFDKDTLQPLELDPIAKDFYEICADALKKVGAHDVPSP